MVRIFVTGLRLYKGEEEGHWWSSFSFISLLYLVSFVL